MASGWTRPETVELSIKAVLGPAMASGSQAFPVLGSNNGRWYVKAPNNPQGPQILVTECLMSLVGALIGAPVCDVQPIVIPQELAGFQVVGGPLLQPGIGCASRVVEDVREIRGTMSHRDRDDNARRHGGVFAFYDLCWGDDPQWLIAQTEDQRLYSHDHGFYLPPGGQNWTAQSLADNVATAHPVPGDAGAGLDRSELERLASALRQLSPADLEPIVASIPAAWPVTDADLAAVQDCLTARAPQVATRIDELRARLEATS